jgi:hypothetical protein
MQAPSPEVRSAPKRRTFTAEYKLSILAETPEKAVELLGLADRASQELTGWMAHWQLLHERRRDLEAALGAERFAVAWERGGRLELNTVVEQLLAELAGE